MSLSPFDFLNSINTSKEDVMVDDQTEKQYSGYMVNRGLSYFPDTILVANEMNLNPHIDNRLQYDFLLSMVRKRKRFSKWAKPEVHEGIQAVKEFYGYSNEKAREAMKLLSSEQIEVLKEKTSRGGRKGKK